MTTIALGFPDTILHEATAAAVVRVLEAHDAEVELVRGPLEIMGRKLRSGEIDLFVAAWLPDNDADLIGNGQDIEALGQLYRPSFHFCVSEAAGRITTIAELATSDAARVIVTPESMMEQASQALVTYGLTKAGFTLDVREDELAFAHAATALQSAAPCVIPLMQPNFLFHDSRLQILDDPKRALGSEQLARILLTREMRGELDSDLVDELDELTLGNKVISALDSAMRNDGMSADEAAEAWQRGRLLPR